MKKNLTGAFYTRYSTLVGLANIVLMLVVGAMPVMSQRLEPSVLAAAGGVIPTTEGGSLSWTLGEIIIDEIRNQSVSITQGFQQGDFKISTSFHNPEFQYDISTFPNPVERKMQIQSDYPGRLNYRLYSPQGHLISHGEFTHDAELDAESWTDGFYFMAIKSDQELIASIIIERIH